MKNACIDKPTKFDYIYEEIFGGSTNKAIKFPFDKITIPNQGIDEDTEMSCTRQGLANITNGNNLIYQGQQDIGLAKRLWIEYCNLFPEAKTTGATLQSSLQQFLDKKLISGYSVVRTIEECKSALDNGRFIFTGSNNGDWLSVRNNKLYALRTDGKIVGHAFCIVGYDESGFIGINSYGQENGKFSIPFDLITTTFTKYSISDYEDIELINNYKKIMQQEAVNKAIELGITNGTELERPILRREAILMIMRLYELLKDK